MTVRRLARRTPIVRISRGTMTVERFQTRATYMPRVPVAIRNVKTVSLDSGIAHQCIRRVQPLKMTMGERGFASPKCGP